MDVESKVFRLSIPTADVAAFLEACEGAAWYAFDTGERVMTDEGPDAEAILLVEPQATPQRKVATAIAQ
jgi:hypothetical protein